MADEKKISRFGVLPQSPAAPALTTVGLRPKGAGLAGPVTTIGMMAAEQAKGLLPQLEELRKERENGRVVLSIDPKRVRPTQFYNRDSRSLAPNDPDLVALTQSIRENGQEVPGKVRPLEGSAEFDFELVSGHRRHAACLALDRELPGGYAFQALLDASAAETQQLVLKMFRENELRTNPSPYERGMAFEQWLTQGVFDSQAAMAKAIGVDGSHVARCRGVARLPLAVLAAFGDPRVIAIRWSTPLESALKADIDRVLAKANELAALDPRPAPDAVFTALCGPSAKRPAKKTSREEKVRIGDRVPLKVVQAKNKVILKFHHVSPALQKELNSELKDWVEDWLTRRLGDS